MRKNGARALVTLSVYTGLAALPMYLTEPQYRVVGHLLLVIALALFLTASYLLGKDKREAQEAQEVGEEE